MKTNIVFLLCSCFMLSAQATELPLCHSSQVKVVHLGLDAPGMSQTNDIYGVINTSSTSCQIRSAPVAVKAIFTNKKPIDANKIADSNLVLTPRNFLPEAMCGGGLSHLAFVID